jgi:hypothetical protein
LAYRQQQRRAGSAPPGIGGGNQAISILVGSLGESDRCQHADTERLHLPGGRGSHVHERVVDSKGSAARIISPPREMNRSNGYNGGNRPAGAADRDPLAFDLLIEEGTHLSRYPAECQIAIGSDPADDKSRLVQRTSDQPSLRAAPQSEADIAGAVSPCLREEPEETVHHLLFVPGNSGPA